MSDDTVSVVLPCGRLFQLNASDVVLLAGRNWFSERRGRTFYVRGRSVGQNKGGIYLHHHIIGGRADHRDGNGLNNARSNIRGCTQHQNCLNRAPKKGKLFKGVYKRGPSFVAQIYFNGKSYSSGAHKTMEAAALAYDNMAIELHGDFARLNFPMLDRKDARQGQLFAGAAE